MHRFFVMTALFAMAASAQTPRRERALNDTLQSPEGHITLCSFG